jgi:hypothetical protein
MSLTLMLGLAALFVLATVWWGMVRLRRVRAEEARRSEATLAQMRAGQHAAADPRADAVATFFAGHDFDDGQGASPRALEVAEFDAGVDIEALLGNERQRVAQITQADLPPGGVVPSAPAQRPAAVHSVASWHSAESVSAAAPPVAGPVSASAVQTPPVRAPAVMVPAALGENRQAAVRQPSASVSDPAASAGVASFGSTPASERLTDAPMRRFVGGGDLVRNVHDAPPLREIALAWFETRGYRSAPASPAVRPIERVLRHHQDATRGYAFVVESQPVSERRVEQLQALALSVGLKRLLVVAEAGAPEHASREHRGVRLMDRNALAAELDLLDLSIAAKIIAVARKRSAVTRI